MPVTGSILRTSLAPLLASSALWASAAAAQSYATEPEYTINYSLSAIHAAAAFTAGYTGAGVTVAVLDSGINRSNPDLSAPGKVLAGYDFVDNVAGVNTDLTGHGTFVSGIVAAARNGWGVEGVAFNATILPEIVINSASAIGVGDSGLAAAVNYGINNGARIFNNSYNSTTLATQVSASVISASLPSTVAAFQNAVSKGALFIFSAGNDSQSQPGFLSAMPAYYTALKAGWISAVATDQSGAIASYSNRCGITAAWCMAAPGTSINSTYGTGIANGWGTSFAAPQIAGAAAILLQEWPYLTAGQVGQILLITANKTGIYADQSTYGQGMLDLNAAIQPSGPTLIPTGGSGSGTGSGSGGTSGGSGGTSGGSTGGKPPKHGKTVTASGGIFGPAFGGGYGAGVGQVLMLDQFERGYTIPATALLHGASGHFDTVDLMGRFGNEDLVELAPGVKAAFSDGDPEAPVNTPRMRMQITGQDGHVLETSFGTDPALAYGAFGSGAMPADALIVEDGVGNPYLNLATAGPAMRFGSRLGAGSVSFGLFEGYSRSASLMARLSDPSYTPPHVFGAIVEASRPVDSIGANLAVDAGAIVEQGSFLGSTTSGAFGDSGETPTAFVGATGQIRLGRGLNLIGSYHVGQTDPGVSTGGLVQHYGTVRSESFAVGLVARDIAGKGDHAGLVFSQPLRVGGGSAQLNVPYATDILGNVLTHLVDTPVAAQGRELDFQGFYTGQLDDGLKFDAGMVARFEPDNQRNAPTDLIALVKIKQSF